MMKHLFNVYSIMICTQEEEYTNMISIYSQLIKALIKAWVEGKAR